MTQKQNGVSDIEFLEALADRRTSENDDASWYVGSTESGDIVKHSWDNSPHLVFGGRPGSGKTVLLSSMIQQLSHNRSDKDVNVWLLDPIGELESLSSLSVVQRYKGAPDESEGYLSAAVRLVIDARNEMSRRYGALSAHPSAPTHLRSARDIARAEAGEEHADHPLYFPRLFVVIDDFHLASTLPLLGSTDDVARGILIDSVADIARKSQAVGIHLVLSSQTLAERSVPRAIRDQAELIAFGQSGEDGSGSVAGINGLGDLRSGNGKVRVDGSYQTFRGFDVRPMQTRNAA